MPKDQTARLEADRALEWCSCCGRATTLPNDTLCGGCRTSADHKAKRQGAAAAREERAARRIERLTLDPRTPAHLAVFAQAVQRAGYEARLRTVRVGSTPFTLARFMRGQKWALDHRERIQAALDADPRLVRIRGKGHPQWRRAQGTQTQLPVVTVVELAEQDGEPAAQ